MQNKLGKKFSLSILSLVITCVVTFFAITYCWFATNSEVDTSSFSVTAKESSGIEVVAFQIYKRDGALDEAVKIADESTSDFTFEMTEYDSIFTDRNVNTPIVIRAVLTGKGLQVPDRTISATLSCPSGTFLDKNGKLQQYISNVLNVNCATIPELDDYDMDEDANKIYTEVVKTFDNANGTYAKQFVNITDTPKTIQKINSLTFTISDYVLDKNNDLIVYFELNYAEKLAREFIDDDGINIELTEMQDILYFQSDIKHITFDFGEDE